eukprot:7734952-Pyramimonas_sp.AAC.1
MAHALYLHVVVDMGRSCWDCVGMCCASPVPLCDVDGALLVCDAVLTAVHLVPDFVCLGHFQA